MSDSYTDMINEQNEKKRIKDAFNDICDIMIELKDKQRTVVLTMLSILLETSVEINNNGSKK